VPTAIAAVGAARTKFWEPCRATLISWAALPWPPSQRCGRSKLDPRQRASALAAAHLAGRQRVSGSASLLITDDQQERPLVGRRRLLCHMDATELSRPSRVPDKGRRPGFAARRASLPRGRRTELRCSRISIGAGAERRRDALHAWRYEVRAHWRVESRSRPCPRINRPPRRDRSCPTAAVSGPDSWWGPRYCS
jgi:hypothetical protein